MKLPRKKQPEISRNPHLERRQQTTFHYSSNRSQSERNKREQVDIADSQLKSVSRISKILGNTAVIIFAIFLIASAILLSSISASPKIVLAKDSPTFRNINEYSKSAADASGGGLNGWNKFTLNR